MSIREAVHVSNKISQSGCFSTTRQTRFEQRRFSTPFLFVFSGIFVSCDRRSSLLSINPISILKRNLISLMETLGFMDLRFCIYRSRTPALFFTKIIISTLDYIIPPAMTLSNVSETVQASGEAMVPPVSVDPVNQTSVSSGDVSSVKSADLSAASIVLSKSKGKSGDVSSVKSADLSAASSGPIKSSYSKYV
ncbi:hypothetical protein YC2023_023797 [Brassica napus]